jgi:hypothetical protein
MTQNFVGTREQVLSALMHATRQFQQNGEILDCRFARSGRATLIRHGSDIVVMGHQFRQSRQSDR